MYLVPPMPKNSKRMLGYQDLTNADGLINQNKACFQAFLQEIYWDNWPEMTKDYFNVSNLTLLHKNLTFI